ncbi:MAG TPA: NYN domain-containing protein [Acidimicrobiales bacterium]
MRVVKAAASPSSSSSSTALTVDPPRPLVPLLQFARLPDRALATVARVLDEDGSLRARVAADDAASEERIGRAGWLFLTRPDGWRDELDAMSEEASASRAAAGDAQAERTAARRLERVERELAETSKALDGARAAVASARADTAAERAARAAADDELDGLRERVRALELERDAAHRRVARADRLAAEAAAERDRLRDDVGPVVPALPREAVAAAIADATAAASALSDALARAAGLMGAVDAVDVGDGDDVDIRSGAPGPGRSPTKPRSDRVEREQGGVRLPVALPGGLYDDSPEAAEHLVRAARALLLVDGYNASLRAWPDLPIADQRRRMLDALGELAARTGVEALVVFDGTEAAGRAGSLPIRRGVQLRFSPAGREADDVILDLVDAAPSSRPVLVASDDQRVRREAASRGANVLTQAQLFGLLRRERP